MDPRASTDDLFATLRRTGSEAVRATLIERHLPLARSLAVRYAYTPQPLEDLVQVASVGLIKAVDRFDPQRGTAFAGYAVATILGELRRHMRDTAWAVHVPRALKENVLAVERAERVLTARLAGAPTVDALAAEAGLPVEDVLEALAARVAHDAVPIDGPGPGGEGTATRPDDAALVSADSALESAADRVAISRALELVAPREQMIVRLRFVDGLTQTEIAERVGLSQMQVSRVLRATLDALRAQLDSSSSS
jgi:RNA polymerase sigma-B factor